MDRQKQLELTNEIIETSYKLLINKLAHGGITAKNENSFQLELGFILKTIGQLYEFRLVDKFQLDFETYINLHEQSIKSQSEKARIDILIEYRDNEYSTKSAIELKFFKKENHREPNNRYDVFKDLSNLELYKKNNIDVCYFILATDHKHYVNQNEYSIDTKDFDFRDKAEYKSNTILEYRTDKPYGNPIKLNNSYNFNWIQIKDLYFLKVKI